MKILKMMIGQLPWLLVPVYNYLLKTFNYVVEPTIHFVGSNLAIKELRAREAAVMAFGSILDGPDHEQLKHIIAEALQPILLLIKDSDLQMKETVAWCLGRIADMVVDAIDIETNYPIY